MYPSTKRQRTDSSAQSEAFHGPSQQGPMYPGPFPTPSQQQQQHQQQQMGGGQQTPYGSAFPAQQPNNFWPMPFPPQQHAWTYNGMPDQHPHFQHYGQFLFPQQQNPSEFTPPSLPPLRYHPPPVPHGITLPSDVRMAATLPETRLRKLLIELVEADGTGLVRAGLVAGYLREQQKEQHKEQQEEQRKEQARVISFDSYSQEVSRAINMKGTGRTPYEESWDVTAEVVTCIKDIGKQVEIASSFDTKLNALETLCKIAESILLSTKMLGHAVRKQFRNESVLVETMEAILEMMSPGDRLLAGSNVSEPGKDTLLEKMKYVRAYNATSYVIEGLDVSNACMELGGVDEEEDSEEDDEDDEDDTDEDEQEEGDQKNVDFEACAAKVDFIVNDKYSALHGSEQYDKTFDAYSKIQSQIEIIEKNAGPNAPFRERLRALRALIRIGYTVDGSQGGILATKIEALFTRNGQIPKLIITIIKTFDESQRQIAAEDHLGMDLEAFSNSRGKRYAELGTILASGPGICGMNCKAEPL